MQFLLFAFVEDAQEKHPRQFGDVLQRARAIAAAHDVADSFDIGVERLWRAERDAAMVVGFCHISGIEPTKVGFALM